MRLFPFLIAVALLTVGCSAPLRVDRMSEARIDSADKEIVLLNRSRWDADLIRALSRRGFNVKRFASTRVIEGPIAGERTERFREAAARYGITQYPGSQVDWCVLNNSVKIDRFTVEVSDLRTNKILMFVETGGWTGDCAYHSGSLFSELADVLAKEWH
jgi:hypothetical protein